MTSSTAQPSFSHYQILGINPSATSEEIAKSYKIMVKKYGHSADDKEHYGKILVANQVLSDPTVRKVYDEKQQNKPSTTMLRFPTQASGAAGDSTALVVYQEVDLAFLMSSSKIDGKDLYEMCTHNKDLAIRIFENEELRKKLTAHQWALITIYHPVLTEKFLAQSHLLSQIENVITLRFLCEKYKKVAEYVLKSEYATKLPSNDLSILMLQHDIKPEQLHPDGLSKYQSYQKLLTITADEKINTVDLVLTIKQAVLKTEDIEVINQKNKNLLSIIWKHVRDTFDHWEWLNLPKHEKSLTVSIYCEYIEHIDIKNLTSDEKICEDVLSQVCEKLIAKKTLRDLIEIQQTLKAKNFTRCLQIFNKSIETHPKFKAYKLLSKWSKENFNSITPLLVSNLFRDGGLSDWDLFYFLQQNRGNTVVFAYFWDNQILRNQIPFSDWGIFFYAYEKIAIEFCKPHLLEKADNDYLKIAATKYKSVAILLLASPKKNIFSGKELSELVKLHGPEVLKVILENNLGMELQAYELLNSALQQKDAFVATDDKNPQSAKQAQIHFLIVLADRYVEAKKYREAEVRLCE